MITYIFKYIDSERFFINAKILSYKYKNALKIYILH